MIPDDAVKAATKALYWNPASNGAGKDAPETWVVCERAACEILEAALPILLSHEREETRLAHLDAVVNAESLSKYEDAIDAVLGLADQWQENFPYKADRIRAAIDEALGS